MTPRLHIAIGTPQYGGQSLGVYNRSVKRLYRALTRDGHRLSEIALGNESLINRARNTVAWHFLQSDATHLLFVDGDVGFRVEDIARMVSAEKPILVAPCPLKVINWERVHRAALAGHSAEELPRFAGMFNIVHLDGERCVSSEKPFEIKWGGTGLMLIERHVFQKLKDHVPTYRNRCPGDAMPPGAIVHDFFPTYVKDEDLLSEDYGFCEAWRGAGGKVWAAPWCELVHFGGYAFTGSYKDIFAAEASSQALKDAPESADKVLDDCAV